MVCYEEDIARVEDEIMRKIHDEVCNAVFQDGILKIGVDRCESTIGVGKDGVTGQENSRCAMRE